MRHLIGDRHCANERECGGPQSMDGHPIARFEHKGNLCRELRRGFDLSTVFQYHPVNIASRSERQPLDLAPYHGKLLWIVNSRLHCG
jgi:hypothetical protein